MMLSAVSDIKVWLINHKIENYVINDDMTVDVKGSVDLEKTEIKEIQVQFGTIEGDFNCEYKNLGSTQGFPRVVRGSFICGMNNLTTLIGGPMVVEGDYYCDTNLLTSLEGCPFEVGGMFTCGANQLTSFEHCPSIIAGDFKSNNNQIEDLTHFPKKIGGMFILSQRLRLEKFHYLYEQSDPDVFPGLFGRDTKINILGDKATRYFENIEMHRDLSMSLPVKNIKSQVKI